ncbi:ComEC/Rec2 family competence protein, partial [Candidatus Saccharibacteria bacterium]|nr:ComEC/Rec2 family competence protein [Candidatus Saccharibacteria bacterium]
TMFGSLVWLFAGCGIGAIAFWRRTVYLIPIVLVAGLFIGLWRGSILENQLVVYESIIGNQVLLEGTVGDDPDVGKHGEVLLRLNGVVVKNHPVAGKIWISLDRGGDIKRGDRVAVTGKATEGFGNFSAAIYKAKIVSVKRPQPGDVARQARDWFADEVRAGIAEPQASLGIGYLLGQRRALPPELAQALVITGLTHVVVASGYNLTILVRLARRLFVKVSKYLATLSASVMILGFMAITGASPSMTRAGLVSGLSLAAWYYGRRFHPLVLLPFAAAITVLIDPAYAWNDLGWQLSFAAFAGVMILAPLLQRYFFGDKKAGTVRQILGETISASILTLPILVLAFGQFSNVAIITNLLVLPLVPLAMLLVFVTGICGLALPGVAAIIGAPAQWLLTYMTSVVHYFAGLPWAQTVLEIQPWMVWLSYAIIISVCIYLWRATKYDLSQSNIVE